MKALHPILFWHPILVGLWFGVGLVTVGLSEVIRSVDRSGHLRTNVAAAAASLAAEEAAFVFVSELGLQRRDSYKSASGLTCAQASQAAEIGRPMRIWVRDVHGARHDFEFEALPGGTPGALGQQFTVLPRGNQPASRRLRSVIAQPPVTSSGDGWPELHPSVAELSGQGWRRTGALHQDSALALLRLPAGTDRPDFTLGSPGETFLRPDVPPSGVLRLDGHLWLDHGDQPLVLELDDDLTIAVRGNLYLGRSLHVRGPGRLVLVVSRWRGDMFRDLDLDGRFSNGDELLTSRGEYQGSIEGSGAVYVGLPAGSPIPDTIRLDASLVVDGELHLQSPRTEIRGALAVGYGVTGAVRDHVLLPLGLLLPDTERELLPGFVPVGQPRPGILRRL